MARRAGGRKRRAPQTKTQTDHLMPDLIIDGLRVVVPEGTTVMEAAEQAGIMIPRLCYHPALTAVGSCRMCAVMFVGGARPGLDMSCMVKARDGMVVDTNHPEAVEYRRRIAELLMLDHPHDCPVCDEGGQCLLQDMIISCGHSRRVSKGKKRTYHNQDLGPLIVQEMNRCIHCYRCVRYYQEFAGGSDFGAMRIAGDVTYRRAQPGPLESVFSGNLADICPTGVFTDKPSRHKARHWDMERAPCVCLSCSLGCNTTVSARHRSVIRLEPRVNPFVNGHFLCDRGRYSYEYANLPERPRTARVDGITTDVHAALDEATARLQGIREAHGPGSVACLGSSRQAVESQGMLRSVSNAMGWLPPEYTTSRRRKQNLLSSLAGLDKNLHVSQADIARSDCILIIGAAPLSEAPMLALAVRQAARQGAAVAVIDPRPVAMPLSFLHIPASRRDMEDALGAILRRAFADAPTDSSAHCAAFLSALTAHMPASAAVPGWEEFAHALSGARFPVVICGSDIVAPSTPALAAGAAEFLATARGRAGFFPVLAGANAFGAALMNFDSKQSFDGILDAIEAGTVKALVCVESDPLSRYAGYDRVWNALQKLELLVCVDYLPTPTAKAAHVFVPSQTVFEAGGSFINQEGRLQIARPAHVCGLPMDQTLETGIAEVATPQEAVSRQASPQPRPPRRYATVIPGSDPLPAWRILALLAQKLGIALGPQFHPWHAVTAASPALAVLLPGGPRDQALIMPRKAPGAHLAARPGVLPAIGGVDLILTEMAFGTEELSCYGSIWKSVAPDPEVLLNTLDAESIKVSDEQHIHITCGADDSLGCFVRTAQNMARGAAILPRRPDIAWQRVTAALRPGKSGDSGEERP